jgi:hypothetical protein
MKAKYKIGDRVQISDSTRVSGRFGIVSEVDLSGMFVEGPYYQIDLEEVFVSKMGYELSSVGRSERELAGLSLPSVLNSITETDHENTENPPVEMPRIIMPVCPYCKTEMKPFDFRGYYDDFVGWECQCNDIPNAEIQRGQYA